MNISIQNRGTYERANIVQEFAAMSALFGAEKALIEHLGPRLKTMDMLDLGVGAGRTTERFAHLCKSYVGTDYARAMVAACEARFGGRYRVLHNDARDMGVFADASFDFVLFSFNGLDYVPHDDRAKVLAEIWRVMRPGGVFAFSTHNLQVAPDIFRWRPLRSLRHVARYAYLLVSNLGYLIRRPVGFAVLQDGAEHFGLRTHYIAPEAQVADLERAGFVDIRIVSQEGVAGTPGPQPTFICHKP